MIMVSIGSVGKARSGGRAAFLQPGWATPADFPTHQPLGTQTQLKYGQIMLQCTCSVHREPHSDKFIFVYRF